MIQRKCGTCKYFEEGGIAASGWCRHPERQALEHMVLVRRNELACRDGWDHDLWEPRDGQQGASKRRSRGKTPRIDSDATVISESMPVRLAKPRDIPAEGDSKTPRDITAARFERPDQVESVPRSSAGRHQSRPGGHEPSELGQPADFPAQVDELRDESVSIRPSGRQRLPASVTMGPAGWTDYPPSTEVSRADEAPVPESNGVGAPTVIPSPPVQQSGNTEPFTFDDESDTSTQEQSLAESDHSNGFAGDVQSDHYEDYDVGRVDPPVVGNLKPCCRNCRDFIPQDGGRQGWCSNPFAFDTRTLVDGDSLACQSSLGSWWSPSDDWWMEPADIAHHSAPTPLVDNLIRELRNRLLGAEGSTEEQERS